MYETRETTARQGWPGVLTTEEFNDWMCSLPARTQEKVLTALNWLEAEGPHTGRPQVDAIKGSALANLKELRIPHGDMVLRVFFVFDPQRNGVILCGGDKAGDKRFYRPMIALAEELYREYLADPAEANPSTRE